MSFSLVPRPLALEIEGVGFAYGSRVVLNEVSIQVPAGAFCVLLGVNGAGKTTLFSLITRLFLCQQGTIRILGRDLRTQVDAVRRQPKGGARWLHLDRQRGK